MSVHECLDRDDLMLAYRVRFGTPVTTTKENPMTTTAADVEQDITRLADLQALVAEATSEMDSIKGRLRAAFASNPGTHEIAGYRLSVTPQVRFDETQARDVLPDEVLATATVAKLDGAAVKRMVAPTVYALCCKVAGEPRVVLR